MGFVKLTKFSLVAIVLTASLSSFASAQPFQKPLRWLGEGFSAGYHRCNPGPDVDYYNPWNAHNSMLISRLPQFQNQNFQSYNTSDLSSRQIYQGVPYSVYAAPRGQHGYGYGSEMQGMENVPSAYSQGSSGVDSVESSFEPYQMDDEAEEEEELDEDEWNDDDNEWGDDAEGIEDDSARIQAPVPSGSSFSGASFQKPDQVAPPNSQDLNLFNPFPGN